MTSPPPIVPGPQDEFGLPIAPPYQDPPTVHQPPPQPMPVYHPYPQPAPEWKPSRAAGNTVVVIATIVGLFCVLPCLLCLVTGTLGNLLNR